MAPDTKIIRNFDALRETLALNATDNMMVGQKQGGRGGLIPRRMEMNTFITQFFGMSTFQALLCAFLDGAVESIGTGTPVYDGFDATTCMAQFRSLTAGTNVTLDDTTNPGEIIIDVTVPAGGDGIYGGSGAILIPTTVTMGGNLLTFTGGDVVMDGCLGVGGGVNPLAQILVTTAKRDGINIGNTGAIAGANGLIVRNLSTGTGNHLGANILATGANASKLAGVRAVGGISAAIPNLAAISYDNIGILAEGYGTGGTHENVGVYGAAVSAGALINTGGHFRAEGATTNYGLIVESGRATIGGTTSDVSAILQLNSTTQGLVIPRMSTAQETTLAGTAINGLIIYNTDTDKFRGFAAGAFVDLN